MEQTEHRHDRDAHSGEGESASAWEAALLELADGRHETLREDGEFVYYRNRHRISINGTLKPTLVVAPVREHTGAAGNRSRAPVS